MEQEQEVSLDRAIGALRSVENFLKGFEKVGVVIRAAAAAEKAPAQAKAELERLQGELASLMAEKEKLEAALPPLRAEYGELMSKLTTARKELEALRQRIEGLLP
jgi:chromosome segregation ATPase